MAIPLTLQVPQLVTDPPGFALLERAVAIKLGPIAFPDGQPVTQDDVARIGLFVYRILGGEQVWDEARQDWSPVPADPAALAALTPLPLMYKDGDPAPWRGTLVAAGQRTGAGAPRYAKALGGAPAYRVRAFVQARQRGNEHAGIGPASPDLVFSSLADSRRFELRFDTGDAQSCGRVTLILKDGALAPVGFVDIRGAGDQEVEIASCSPGGAVNASITLLASGDILLKPGAGGKVILDGPLEAGRIDYQPQAGGPRQTL